MPRVPREEPSTKRWVIIFIVSAIAATAFGYWYSQRWASIRMEAIRVRDSAQAAQKAAPPAP